MGQTRRRRPKYRHLAPAFALVTGLVLVMAGVTGARLGWIGVADRVVLEPRSVGRAEAAGVVTAPVVAAPVKEAPADAPRVIAAAPSPTLASAAPPPPSPCDGASVENRDPTGSDIARTTGLPGHVMYYGRKNTPAVSAACGQPAQTARTAP